MSVRFGQIAFVKNMDFSTVRFSSGLDSVLLELAC